jgi:AcrR family transcriptional regulator
MPTATETPTRERILYTAAELFRRQGYAGTGLKQVLAEAGAPFGSMYHFFPGGKEELADEVLATGGRFFLALYEGIAADAPDLEGTVTDFFAGAGQTLVATDYQDACPIATVAGEVAGTHERLRGTTATAFESWFAAFESDAVEAGVEPAAARALAISVVAILEGAFLLCRSLRSTEPMDAAGESALALVRAALAASAKRSGARP